MSKLIERLRCLENKLRVEYEEKERSRKRVQDDWLPLWDDWRAVRKAAGMLEALELMDRCTGVGRLVPGNRYRPGNPNRV